MMALSTNTEEAGQGFASSYLSDAVEASDEIMPDLLNEVVDSLSVLADSLASMGDSLKAAYELSNDSIPAFITDTSEYYFSFLRNWLASSEDSLFVFPEELLTIPDSLRLKADSLNLSLDSVFSLYLPPDTLLFYADSLKMPLDSIFSLYLPFDSIYSAMDGLAAPIDSVPEKKSNAIESDLFYNAKDSIVLIGTTIAILYGEAQVRYEGMTLSADYIRLRLDSNTVYATGSIDSTGTLVGKPVFTEGKESFEANSMRYNFETKKGFIYGTVTNQGDGYVTSDKTKKIDEDTYCLQGGKYTTCDNHEHPHFYLALTKAKMKQGRYIVSGPAYMVVEDIPLPLAVPFGYFPFTKSYSSGIITPTFGEESSRGFYAEDFGYYFAINDYVDLALTADVYSKGSWALMLASTYKWRYKFSGSFNFSYNRNIYGTPGTADYSASTDFRILWSHTQDSKMSPNTTFSASVNFSTSSYDRNNIDSYYNASQLSQNTKSSTITFSQKLGDSPFTLSASMYLTQRTSDSTLSLSLPSVVLNMSRVYPFKRSNSSGSDKWYEKIALTYTFNLGNSITTTESQFANMNFLRDWNNGMEHEFPISASFTLAKYLNLSVSMSNSLKWYFRKVSQSWEGDYNGSVVADTTYGFYNIYDFSGTVSLSTTLYGFYTLKSKNPDRKMPIFRHKMVPTISFSAAPDFGTSAWGYWSSYMRPDADGVYHEVWYDYYDGGIYGDSPSRGATGTLSFSLTNNLEMKYWSRKDTSGNATKVSIIDNLSINGSYNFIADSLNWSNITMNVRFKLWSEFTMNVNFTFDPYTYALNSFGSAVKVNVTQWQKNHIPFRLQTVSTSFGYTFNNDTFKKKSKDSATSGSSDGAAAQPPSELEQTLDEVAPIEMMTAKDRRLQRYANADGDYKKAKIPWSLTFNYSVRYAYSTFNYETLQYDRKLTHNLSLSGSISFTDTWSATVSAYYDITNGAWSYVSCTVSKDLHCWQMSCSFVPIGTYKTYNFAISAKATILSDLKYEKQSESSSRVSWF